MVRLVLIFTLMLASVARAQDPAIGAYEELAREMQARDWQGALIATQNVLDYHTRSNPLRESVECMHALLLELRLREHLVATPEGMPALSRELQDLANVLQDLAAQPRCVEAARRAELSYLRPRVERAARLTAEARDSGSVSAELEQVFMAEHGEIVAQIQPGPEDAWERAERLWLEQRTPEPRDREWPARSEAPVIGTGVLIVGFGLVSFFSTLTVLSGRGLPSLSAGGWGITFSLLPALASAWTWERPKRGLLIASLAMTAIAAAGGAIGIARLDRDGRYFGRGLLIGSAVSAVWQVGGWIHHRYPNRSRRQWQERVRFSPVGGPGFGGLGAGGRF